MRTFIWFFLMSVADKALPGINVGRLVAVAMIFCLFGCIVQDVKEIAK